MTYEEYIKKQQEITDEQLKKQSEINANVNANALASAATGAVKAGTSMMTGGAANPDDTPSVATAEKDMSATQQEAPQPSTEGPVDQPKPDYSADDNPRNIAIAKDIVGQESPYMPLPAEKDPNYDESKPWYENAYPDWTVISEDDGSGWIDIESPDGERMRIMKDKPSESRMWLAPRPGSPADKRIKGGTVDAPNSGNPGDQVISGGTADTPNPDTPQTPDNTASASSDSPYAGQIKLFSDMINEQSRYKEQQEKEMRQQEQANMMSSMATGTTELAAGIINMLSVGELHASNQQYRSTSQDWMRKAEQDNREHRARQRDIRATLDRLQAQKEQVATAAKIEDMRLRQQQAAAEQRAAAEESNRKMREQKEKEDRDADMLARGFVPDETAPGGYRFDPDLAARIAASKKVGGAAKGAGKTNTKPSSGTPSTKVNTPSSSSRQSSSNTQPSASTSQQHVSSSAEGSKNGSGDFRDYATRLPRNEQEWERKRNVYGWEENPLGVQSPDNIWAQYKV